MNTLKTLTTHLPENLFRHVEHCARKERISLDQFVTVALSAQVSAWMTKDYLRERSERGSWEKFQSVLDKVPDVEPEEHDNL